MSLCKQCKVNERNPDSKYLFCKECMAEYKRQSHWNRNLDIKRFIYEYRKQTPCVDCGLVGNPMLVEFDHIKGDKKFNLAHAFMKKGMTIDIVKQEIAKCEIRCNNCHRIKTHRESNSWIHQMWEQENSNVTTN